MDSWGLHGKKIIKMFATYYKKQTIEMLRGKLIEDILGGEWEQFSKQLDFLGYEYNSNKSKDVLIDMVNMRFGAK